MKKVLLAAMLVILALSAAQMIAAQSPVSILKKATKAMGGDKSWRNVSSRQATGTIVRISDGATGKYQIMTQQPNLYNESFDVRGFEVATGYNGKSGWQRDSKTGLRTLTGKASLDLNAEAVFRNSRWFNYKSDKAKISAGGQQNIGGKPTNVVILTTAKNVSLKLYFDQTSGLLVREEIPMGEQSKTFDYSDFRQVEGTQEPFKINAKIADEIYEINFDRITHNAQLARSDFDFPKLANEPLPNVPQLLQELQANEDKVDEILETYTYVQTSTSRELGKDGRWREKDSETFQITSYKGYQLRRLTAKNGTPLAASEQEKENNKVQKRVEEIEKKITKQQARATAAQTTESGAPPSEDGPKISIAEVLRASNLVNPRRERFRNRDVIVFDFEPNPNFDFDNTKNFLKFFGKTAGVIWVDEQDKQVARLEAFLIDNFNVGGGLVAKLKKGASFTLEQERVGNEIWLPSIADINLSVKVFLVKGINVNQIIKSGNYEKFNTEIKNAAVEEAQKP